MNELKDLMDTYLQYCETVKELNFKTIKAYRIDLRQFALFLNLNKDITNKLLINEYIASIKAFYHIKKGA